MIAQITKALEKGFTEDQILDFIVKKFPKFASKITGAKVSGFNASQILHTLLGDKKNREKDSEPTTEYEEMLNREKKGEDSRNRVGKSAALMGATALAAPMAASALQRAIPTSLQTLIPSMTSSQQVQPNQTPLIPSPPNQEQDLLNTSQQPPANNIAASIPEPANIQQDKGKSSIVDKLWNNFEKGKNKGFDFESDAFLKIASRMKSTGEIRSKEDFERFFNLFDQKKNEGKDLPAALREASAEYDTQKLSLTEQLTKNEEPQLQETKQLQEPIQEQEKPKIEKKSLVSSPNGIGEIKEIRNGQAIIDVDGKLHKVKEEDLESSPIPEKDLADLHDDLLRGIESETGEDVSRMVQWAGYNPETNTLQFLPHTGKLYKYGNISPEDAALLTDILSVRKTSGANFIGAWKAGSKSPIGAALSKLIRKLQSERGGKGQEYEETHEPIYSAYEPAIEAKKEKLRKKKKKNEE